MIHQARWICLVITLMVLFKSPYISGNNNCCPIKTVHGDSALAGDYKFKEEANTIVEGCIDKCIYRKMGEDFCFGRKPDYPVDCTTEVNTFVTTNENGTEVRQKNTYDVTSEILTIKVPSHTSDFLENFDESTSMIHLKSNKQMIKSKSSCLLSDVYIGKNNRVSSPLSSFYNHYLNTFDQQNPNNGYPNNGHPNGYPNNGHPNGYPNNGYPNNWYENYWTFNDIFNFMEEMKMGNSAWDDKNKVVKYNMQVITSDVDQNERKNLSPKMQKLCENNDIKKAENKNIEERDYKRLAKGEIITINETSASKPLTRKQTTTNPPFCVTGYVYTTLEKVGRTCVKWSWKNPDGKTISEHSVTQPTKRLRCLHDISSCVDSFPWDKWHLCQCNQIVDKTSFDSCYDEKKP